MAYSVWFEYDYGDLTYISTIIFDKKRKEEKAVLPRSKLLSIICHSCYNFSTFETSLLWNCVFIAKTLFEGFLAIYLWPRYNYFKASSDPNQYYEAQIMPINGPQSPSTSCPLLPSRITFYTVTTCIYYCIFCIHHIPSLHYLSTTLTHRALIQWSTQMMSLAATPQTINRMLILSFERLIIVMLSISFLVVYPLSNVALYKELTTK